MAYPAEHALETNYPKGEVIHSNSVILPTHHFWSHVSGSTGGILGIFGVPDTGDSEISDADVAVVVDDQIFRFDVSV